MKELKWRAVVAGVGGQGVLFATRVLARRRGNARKKYLSVKCTAWPNVAVRWSAI